jgi:hypothetical protein
MVSHSGDNHVSRTQGNGDPSPTHDDDVGPDVLTRFMRALPMIVTAVTFLLLVYFFGF